MSAALLAAALAAARPAAPPAGPEARSLYEQGVAARLAGDPERSILLLRQAAEADPANADLQLQLGLALMAAGRIEEAEAALRETLRLAPAYDDARIALARLARRRGDDRAARAELDRVSPTNPEAAELRSGLAAPGGGAASAPASAHRWRVDLDGSYSALGGGRPDWREASLAVSRRLGSSTHVSGQLERSRRFELDDTYGEVRLDRRLEGGGFHLFAGGTPNADFRPRWQIGGGASVRLRSGPSATILTLDARQAHYRSGDIQTVSPGFEQYLAGGRFWLSGRLINIFDESGRHHLGWLARGDFQALASLRFFAGLADSPDTSAGLVVDTFSQFAGLSWDAGERTTLRLSLAREDRDGGGDRLQIGLGLGLRF